MDNRNSWHRLGIGLTLAGVAVAAVALVRGFAAQHAEHDGRIVCDGKVMRPGDACVVFGGSGGGSYEEMARTARIWAKSDAWVVAEWIGLLGLLLIFGGVVLAFFVKRHTARVRRVVLGVLAVAVAGYAVAVWFAQEQTREQSRSPVGVFGWMMGLDMTYSPLVIAGLSVVGFLAIAGAADAGRRRWRTPEEVAAEAERRSAEEGHRVMDGLNADTQRAVPATRESHRRHAERDGRTRDGDERTR